MYVFILLVAVNVLLFGGGYLLERRRRRRIVEMISANGGQVVRIGLGMSGSSRNVQYIGPQGELREATISRGAQNISQDRPYQSVFREKYPDAGSDMLQTVQLVAEYSRLPGRDAYKKSMLDLAANPDKPISIEESPADLSSQQNRFAPMLQCLEAQAIGSDDEEQLLKLTINGNNFDVSWSVAGQAPNRSLLITATPSQGPPVDLKREAENRASSK